MIVAGQNEIFAIGAEITAKSGGWVLGRFRFVLRNKACGNWKDETDLIGCHSWLKDFSSRPRNRYEPELLTLSPSDIFERLVKPVMVQYGKQRVPEIYEDTFSRFHISHLGMSSFESVTIVLVESADQQRCLWRDRDGPIHSAIFPPRHMQHVAEEFCRLFESELMGLGYTSHPNRPIE